MSEFKYLGIVPSRKGSIRLKNKNIIKIDNKKLIEYTLDAVEKSKYLKKAIITSDYKSFSKFVNDYKKLYYIERPKHLCTSNASLINVIIHSLTIFKKKFNFFPLNIILLQPTSPFRNFNDIDLAIKKFENSNKKTLISISKTFTAINDQIIINKSGKFKFISELINDKYNLNQNYFIDGSIYIINTKYFFKHRKLWTPNSVLFKIKQSHSIDVDNYFDLTIARSLYNYSKQTKKIF